jgi:hypothetical protein
MAQKAVPYSSTTPHDLTDVPARKPSPSFTGDLLSHPFLQALLSAPPPVLLDLVNGLSDDIYTLSRLGLVGPKTGARAARFADWCWLFGTLVGLVENGVETSIVQGQQREGKYLRGRNRFAEIMLQWKTEHIKSRWKGQHPNRDPRSRNSMRRNSRDSSAIVTGCRFPGRS